MSKPSRDLSPPSLSPITGVDALLTELKSVRGARDAEGSSPRVEPGVELCDLGIDMLAVGIGEPNEDEGAVKTVNGCVGTLSIGKSRAFEP